MNTGLIINKLSVKRAQGAEILHGVSLQAQPGQVHVLMGPNGAGKSTLGGAIMGNPDYEVTSGEMTLDGQSITAMLPEERAARGLYLAFQTPVTIPGVSVSAFLQATLNAQRTARGEARILSARQFQALLSEAAGEVSFPAKLLDRSVNDGFSGGEKKRLEMLQLRLFQPKYAVLDETDSGLDIDGMKTIAVAIRQAKDNGAGVLLITHYHRLLALVPHDQVSVLVNGRIAEAGGPELAEKIEADGYKWLKPTASPKVTDA